MVTVTLDVNYQIPERGVIIPTFDSPRTAGGSNTFCANAFQEIAASAGRLVVSIVVDLSPLTSSCRPPVALSFAANVVDPAGALIDSTQIRLTDFYCVDP